MRSNKGQSTWAELRVPTAWPTQRRGGRAVIGARGPARPLPWPRLCSGCSREADVLELVGCGVQAAEPCLAAKLLRLSWQQRSPAQAGDRTLDSSLLSCGAQGSCEVPGSPDHRVVALAWM